MKQCWVGWNKAVLLWRVRPKISYPELFHPQSFCFTPTLTPSSWIRRKPKINFFAYSICDLLFLNLVCCWSKGWPTCIVPFGLNNNIVWQQWVSSVPENRTLLKRKPRTRQSKTPEDVERAATTWLIYSPMAVEKLLPFVSAQGQRLKAVLKDDQEEGHFSHWLFCFTHKLNWAKETSALLSFSFSNDPLRSDSVKLWGLNGHLGYSKNELGLHPYVYVFTVSTKILKSGRLVPTNKMCLM